MNRSLLFIPGHKLEYIYKIKKFVPDIIVIDFEDAVPKNKKHIALKKYLDFIKVKKNLNSKLFLRLDYEENKLPKNLYQYFNKKLNGMILPKIKDEKEIIKLHRLININQKKKKVNKNFKISLLIETPEAVLNLRNIVNSSNKIDFIIYGEEDYHSEINCINFENELENSYAEDYIALVAKSKNIDAIYTPYLNINNQIGLKRHILKSVKKGYSGLLLVHPKQIDLANKYYSPSKQDFLIAKKIINSNKSGKYEGQNISILKKKLVGPPMIRRAIKILENEN
tara:strand:+ start:190 stop:1035 length:846 start_codon:yes stop_codon:yes gene_type:complete